MRIEARAKINWSLDITGQRADGYHLMDMLMQPVTLSDEILIRPAEELTVTLEGNSAIPAGRENIAWKAASLLRDETRCPDGAQIHIRKRIPAQAGMGGGSADAAAVLLGLHRLWGLTLPEDELYDIGLEIGADVPFCLYGGLARVSGIGERLDPLPSARFFPLVIVQPEGGLSTGAVFRAWHAQKQIPHPATDDAALGLSMGDLTAVCQSIGNVLQPVSEAMLPEIAEAAADLERAGAAKALMTGSGSAVFGVFDTARAADRAAEALRERWGSVQRCSTCQQSLIIYEE